VGNSKNTVKIIKKGRHIGAQVEGVDISKSIDQSAFKIIEEAFVENEVLFFRNQQITSDQQIKFAENFGKLSIHPFSPNSEKIPELIIFDNDGVCNYCNNYKKKYQDFNKEDEKKQFLKGAEIAYENILVSFAKGEKAKLKDLLTKDVFTNFEQAIDLRVKEKIKSELTFIGVKESSVEKFEKIKNDLIATVKIVCEIISVKKDKDDKVIEGNPDKIKTVTDYWKFTKNASNKNPNWFLAEIISK